MQSILKGIWRVEQENHSTASAKMSQADMHKGSGFAVGNDTAKWYIAECKPTKEGTIRTMLSKAGYEVYVASRTEEVVYKSRNRRKKEKIVIPGKVFVRTEASKLMTIMLGYSSVHRFMINRLSEGKSYAVVPDYQMQQLQYMLDSASNPVHMTAADLKLNQKVKVMRGALAGLEGWYLKEGKTSYIVIKMEMGERQYIYTEIPLEDIQPIE